MTLFMHWLNVMSIVQCFCELLEKIKMHDIQSNSLRRHLYVLDIATNRQIVHELVYETDATCVAQLRVNRLAFTNLCTMLKSRDRLKASKYLQTNEQMAMFLHIISHRVKNRVIKFQFLRSGETTSKYFHNVLHLVIRLHGKLLKKRELVPENSTDERWKWFKEFVLKICNSYMSCLDRKALQLMVESYVMLYVRQMVCVFHMMLGIRIAMDFFLPFMANFTILVNGEMGSNQIVHQNSLI
ncbi:hypothetical protein UlMin_023814 [Ulmus minor]